MKRSTFYKTLVSESAGRWILGKLMQYDHCPIEGNYLLYRNSWKSIFLQSFLANFIYNEIA